MTASGARARSRSSHGSPMTRRSAPPPNPGHHPSAFPPRSLRSTATDHAAPPPRRPRRTAAAPAMAPPKASVKVPAALTTAHRSVDGTQGAAGVDAPWRTLHSGGERECNSETWELKSGRSIRGDGRCPKRATLDANTRYCVEGGNVIGLIPAYLHQRCLDVVRVGDACLTSRWSFTALMGAL